jgi:hypothetical protein
MATPFRVITRGILCGQLHKTFFGVIYAPSGVIRIKTQGNMPIMGEADKRRCKQTSMVTNVDGDKCRLGQTSMSTNVDGNKH